MKTIKARNRAIIIGAGTHGQVYASYLKEAYVEIIGFIDDDINLIGKEILGLPILGTYEDLFTKKYKSSIDAVYCPIGNNKLRSEYLESLKNIGYNTPSFIHSTVSIAPDVLLGEAIYMLPGNVIMPHVSIGNYVMLNTNTTIAHHTSLGNGVFLSSGVNIGASIQVKKNAFIGMGATIMTGVKEIGMNSLIGAGAVIIKNVPNFSTAVGNPGRIIKTQKIS